MGLGPCDLEWNYNEEPELSNERTEDLDENIEDIDNLDERVACSSCGCKEHIKSMLAAAKAAAEAAKTAADAAKEASDTAQAFSRYQCSVNNSGSANCHNSDDYKELPVVGGDAAHIAGLRPSQSPIAISVQRCPTWNSLEPLRFSSYADNPNVATLTNTGQTAYFTFPAPASERPRLAGGPLLGDYVFEQLHFHWSVDDYTGCEHVLDGHGYACEAHLVHYNSKYGSLEAAVAHADGLAVVGFLLEASDASNPRFDALIAALDGVRQLGQIRELTAEALGWLEPQALFGSYVTYKGSLTTPPYSESVTWIIYEAPLQIGIEQLGVFRQLESSDQKLIERNVRPTQRHPPGHSVIKVEQRAKSKV